MDKKFIYKILAGIVLVFHLFIFAFILLSVPVVIFYPKSGAWVFSFFVLMFISWYVMGGCWTTNLEKWLRKQYAPIDDYQTTFVPYNLKKFLNINSSPKQINVISFAIAITVAAVVVSHWLK
jgi:hypothetical protein